jgi:hypothetical protein
MHRRASQEANHGNGPERSSRRYRREPQHDLQGLENREDQRDPHHCMCFKTTTTGKLPEPLNSFTPLFEIDRAPYPACAS